MRFKVLVVDDSATAREIITSILSSDPDIKEIVTANDAYEARDIIVDFKPDVICLDIEMPKMDGITFLRKIMKYMPTPVVMVSKMTKAGASKTLESLEAGAVDVVEKPTMKMLNDSDKHALELIEKVKSAAGANILNKANPASIVHLTFTKPSSQTRQKVIAIGVSTGGVEALKNFLPQFPKSSPGMLIVQHMPENFTKQLADRLNTFCDIEVREAKNGDILTDGIALIAPGDLHMVLRYSNKQYHVELGTGEKVSGHRPSVDVLFNSVAKTASNDAVGIILTGMGSDGAKGLLNMRKSGAMTFGQDSVSSVVYGMPKVANDLGAVVKQNSLKALPRDILKYLEKV
ncbi:response regulator receiver modulated CheB methylesterase [Sulfurimonas gotlandica GD1]|uniref:Protein-glutamate methylesterase/protein-glutamine glutaminase n=1 Tax=Sulfurimonas gotlandica (strain DSM 19862 / JCM 16533 / GD1) TaxID=929558 RepID=B6BJA8_SULGG|nr:chemotaxis response regulator protein-glutamate methylesterase [Sulfurimonas gotlandica]EDZ62884.1 chemotaxis response regulator protein-glutamate methylesterase [Sulfurimonas gotlandica GD1]EHP30629.1 response regulator receiver modulated CheB methylesterase [Sulfurimonas gotlandica GD1]